VSKPRYDRAVTKGFVRRSLFALGIGLCLWLAGAPLAFSAAVSLGAKVEVLAKPASVLPVRTYTVNGRIWAFAQTKDGRLWLGGSQGLQIFDGKVFAPIEGAAEPRGEIRALVTTPNGDLFVGGVQGLWHLSDSAEHFTKMGHPGEGVTSLAPKGNDVWVGTQRGMFWSEGLELKVVPNTSGFGISALTPHDTKDELWVGTNTGLSILKNFVLSEVWKGGEVHGIAKSAAGIWFAGTENHGLLRKNDDATWGTTRNPTWDWDPSVLSLANDGLGTLWIGISSGLVQEKDGQLRTALQMKDLPTSRVHGLFVDESKNVWLALDGNAIAEVRQDLAIRTYPAQGSDLAFSVAQTKQGELWTTLGHSLRRWDDNTVTDVTAAAKDFWTFRSMQVDTDDSLWVGDFREALIHLTTKLGAFEIEAIPLFNAKVEAVHGTYMGPDGTLWLGFPNGDVIEKRGDNMVRYPASKAGCPAGVLRMLQTRPGELLVATNGRGLCLLNTNTKTFERIGTEGENHISTTSLAKLSDGDVWVGSLQNGVGRLRNKQITWVGYDQGLRADLVGATLEDRNKNVWLAARSGILRINRGQLGAAADRSLPKIDPLVFSTADGLLNSDCISGWAEPALIDKNGSLWVMTLKGPLVMDHPENITAPKWHAPEIVSLIVNGQPERIETERAISAAAAQGNVEFHYHAVAVTEGNRVRYRYMLTGFDKTWIEAGARTEAFYTNLAPGQYRFMLEASLVGWQSTLQMPALTLRLVPPFHRTLPFYMAVALAILLLITTIMRARANTRRRQQQLLSAERRRISQDIHDSLEQTFVAMRFQVDVARRALAEDAPAQGPLDRTMSLMNRAMKETRAAIWALRAEFPGKADLVTQIAIVAGEAAQGQGMQVKVNSLGPPFPVPVDIQRQALQITREALSNAIKHAQAKEVSVEISFTDDVVVLKIKDDGQGFSLSKASSLQGHYGLSGMRERAEQIHAKLEITSQTGEGTVISLTIPRANKTSKSPKESV
jgi:signal transduction histidine kinase/ligand-binding sensor domain-containing protein